MEKTIRCRVCWHTHVWCVCVFFLSKYGFYFVNFPDVFNFFLRASFVAENDVIASSEFDHFSDAIAIDRK